MINVDSNLEYATILNHIFYTVLVILNGKSFSRMLICLYFFVAEIEQRLSNAKSELIMVRANKIITVGFIALHIMYLIDCHFISESCGYRRWIHFYWGD